MATIRERNGRWQVQIRRPDLHATKTFGRLVDARKWARAKESQADRGDADAKTPEGTLAPLIDRYEREIWPIKKWGDTKASALSILARELDRAMPWFTKTNILKYARDLHQKEHLAPGTIATRLSYLRDVFTTGRDLWDMNMPIDQLDAAVAAGRRLRIIGGSQERERRPTDEELQKLLGWQSTAINAYIDLAAVVEVLAILPLRLSELCRIGWNDLIKERRSVIIRQRKHPDIRVKERNDEEVPLINFNGVDTYDLIAGRRRYMERPFPYRANSVSHLFIQACLRLKIDDLHLHDLRAHAISSLLEAEIPIPTVAKLSGHKDWKVLAKHYARLKAAQVHKTIASAGGTRARTHRRTDDDAQPS
jgi:integrase